VPVPTSRRGRRRRTALRDPTDLARRPRYHTRTPRTRRWRPLDYCSARTQPALLDEPAAGTRRRALPGVERRDRERRAQPSRDRGGRAERRGEVARSPVPPPSGRALHRSHAGGGRSSQPTATAPVVALPTPADPTERGTTDADAISAQPTETWTRSPARRRPHPPCLCRPRGGCRTTAFFDDHALDERLAIKFDPALLDFCPDPVRSTRSGCKPAAGRGRAPARWRRGPGGIRWSDRRDDFRTEILGR
jgi:hypothetical protein